MFWSGIPAKQAVSFSDRTDKFKREIKRLLLQEKVPGLEGSKNQIKEVMQLCKRILMFMKYQKKEE